MGGGVKCKSWMETKQWNSNYGFASQTQEKKVVCQSTANDQLITDA